MHQPERAERIPHGSLSAPRGARLCKAFGGYWVVLVRKMMNVGVFEVRTKDGFVGMVSPLSHELVFKKGMPEKAVFGTVPAGTDRILPSNFTANPTFIEFLQGFVAEHMPSLMAFVQEARRLGDGHVYLIDYRTPDVHSDVPPEDILGVFEVKSGEPVSYETNPNYRLFTERGFFVLHPELEARLLAEIEGLQ